MAGRRTLSLVAHTDTKGGHIMSHLGPRDHTRFADDLARSARILDALHSREHLREWFSERVGAHPFAVTPVPFCEVDGWSFDERTGNLGHHTGRFFTVEGMRARNAGSLWHQPIIHQPEIGILGILVQRIDGVLHLLMQAKMEPGNPGLVQLSPTVQATRSNYLGAHRGSPVRYLEHFIDLDQACVHLDVMQSEHGSWFFGKRNRNMVVEVPPQVQVPVHEDFCWMTLGQVQSLLLEDNLINMDTRTVLSCLPPVAARGGALAGPLQGSCDRAAGAMVPSPRIASWLTAQRADSDLRADLLPLYDVPGWFRDDHQIARDDGRFFRVVGVRVHAASREISGWAQPLLEPHGTGVAAFLARVVDGVLHVLVQARAEGGLPTVELGPTVQCVPENYRSQRPPAFLEEVRTAPPGRVWYDAEHSEEGGRFLQARTRYLVVEASAAALDPPPGFLWITLDQLHRLTSAGPNVNVQARTLLSCLLTLGLGQAAAPAAA